MSTSVGAANFLGQLVLPATVPIADKATSLLFLSGHPDYAAACDDLVVQIRRDAEWQWIETDSLSDVCLALLALGVHDKKLLDGKCLARTVQRLVEFETTVGGPYLTGKAPTDLLANACLMQLFDYLGAPLPNVVSYTERMAGCQTESTLARLIASWPKQIIPSLSDVRHIMKDDESFIGMLLSFSMATDDGYVVQVRHAKNIVVERVRTELNTLDEPLRSDALALQRKVSGIDTRQEITYAALHFSRSLATPQQTVTDEICRTLGMANLYFWMSYTVYDDFIDDEGTPKLLPVANVMQRRSLEGYSRSLGDIRFVSNYFDQVDAANSWELRYCRMKVSRKNIVVTALPDYGDKMMLARRAIGHILGPLVVCSIIDTTRKQDRQIEMGLCHYLIARQLNDDLHDWMDDIRRGHISYVVAKLLAALQPTPGRRNLDELTEAMQRQFWDTYLSDICREVIEHVATARRFLKNSKLLDMDGPYLQSIDRIEASALESLRLHKEQVAFFAAYHEPTDK